MATKPVGRHAPIKIRPMKKPRTLIGILFILAGLAALIHPRLKMPAHKTEVQVIGQKLVIETQRIVTIPAIVSALVIVAGAGLVLLSIRKP